MKKITSILLVFVFLVSTLGVSIAIGYCPMKKSYSFSFVKIKSCCCNKADSGKCCKSKTLTLQKVQDDYLSSSYSSVPVPVDFFHYTLSTSTLNYESVGSNNVVFYKATRPPDRSVPLSILHRSLLI